MKLQKFSTLKALGIKLAYENDEYADVPNGQHLDESELGSL